MTDNGWHPEDLFSLRHSYRIKNLFSVKSLPHKKYNF